MSNAEPLLVQAIYSFKGKNNDEVRGFRTNGNETCKIQRKHIRSERLHMISSDVLFHSVIMSQLLWVVQIGTKKSQSLIMSHVLFQSVILSQVSQLLWVVLRNSNR